MNTTYLSVKDCAFDVEVDPESVRRWVRTGKLETVGKGLGGRIMIDHEVWRTFCEKNGLERGKRAYVKGE